TETTAWGVACLAGLQAGVFDSPDAWVDRWQADRCFEPEWGREQAQERLAAWERAVRQATIDT
ncbi:glycerol kinase, partial [Arthrospira platensis SPKY1]|nr:glycerol kinase [Arthrospira platensis SPKY1]